MANLHVRGRKLPKKRLKFRSAKPRCNRVENTLVNEKGKEVSLKPGAPVEVTIEANEKDTVKKEKSTGA
jgi:hypothetical protein